MVLNNCNKYYILYKNQDRKKAEFLVAKGENMYPEYDDFYEPSEGEMFLMK